MPHSVGQVIVRHAAGTVASLTAEAYVDHRPGDLYATPLNEVKHIAIVLDEPNGWYCTRAYALVLPWKPTVPMCASWCTCPA